MIRDDLGVPELTADQVKELRTACFDNSARLIQDAELMLADGRRPARYESAYFALEEVANSSDLYAVAGKPFGSAGNPIRPRASGS